MNREIKFRYWNEYNKEMDYTEMFRKPWQKGLEDFFEYIGDTPLNKIMQYTGEIDKNGKEIYEGDIISGLNGFGNTDKTNIEFHDGGFWPLCADEFEWDDIEVIGNIYENPELLKEEK